MGVGTPRLEPSFASLQGHSQGTELKEQPGHELVSVSDLVLKAEA